MNRLFAASPSVRYVAIYRGGALQLQQRTDLAAASAPESDRYEELLVNPTLLELLSQRGNIDCGGLDYVLIRYGAFFRFVCPCAGGHVSVALEPSSNPLTIVPDLQRIIAGVASTPDVRHVSVYIDRPPATVYEFASNPENMGLWAAGLARSTMTRAGEEWLAEGPAGKVRVRFAERNPFGVMDHDVTLETGVTVHNPMRVVPHGGGSEFVFTVMRQPDMSEAQFAADIAAVERDLKTLKELLERS